ncbi:MAG TPA: hypothetical protein VGJ61_00535 [Solirubrobacterales bacterium]|jgi:hypothetical protein
MVVALIAVGVIAFLAVDAYVLYRIFAGRASADDYGMFMVPGETTVTLPAGQLKISYQEEYTAGGYESSIDFAVPGALKVQITNAAGGDPLPITGPGVKGMGANLDTGRGWSRARVGTVEIVEPGDYTITAGPAIEGGIEPKILLGK